MISKGWVLFALLVYAASAQAQAPMEFRDDFPQGYVMAHDPATRDTVAAWPQLNGNLRCYGFGDNPAGVEQVFQNMATRPMGPEGAIEWLRQNFDDVFVLGTVEPGTPKARLCDGLLAIDNPPPPAWITVGLQVYDQVEFIDDLVTGSVTSVAAQGEPCQAELYAAHRWLSPMLGWEYHLTTDGDGVTLCTRR